MNWEKLETHLLFNGAGEGRSSSAEFNVKAYLDKYADLRTSLGSGNHQAAIKHYLESGISQGRTSAP
jgi:hypothetical protein